MTRAWAEPPHRRRRPRIAAVVFALAVCALLAGTLARWYSPASPAITIVLTGRDASNSRPWDRLATTQNWSRAALDRLEYDLGTDTSAVAAVIVSGAGFARADGPAIAPQSAESPADAISIADILDVFARLPERRAKLLILDCTAPRDLADWGIAHNGFAAALESSRDKIESVPNLTLISASGLGERSYENAERGGSAFAVQLVHGWSGGADRDGDGRVTVRELTEWVTDSTADWARRNRQGVQTARRLFVKGES